LAALRTEGNDRDGEAMELAAEPEASLRDGISSIPGRFSPERPGGASAETGRATPGQATAEVDAGRGARGPVSINALPGLRFLGGSDRIEAGTPAHLVLRGLDAMEATRDPSVTLIDASRFGPVPLARLVHWCDRLVVVARTNAVGMVAVDSMEAALGQPTCPVTLVWRAGRGHLAPRIEAGWAAGVRDVIVLAEESGLRTPLGASQVAIARPRGAVAKCARELAATLGVPAAESRRSTLLKRWRTRENTPRPRRQSGAEHSPGLGGGEPLFGAAKDERDYTGDDPFKSSPIPLGGQRVRKADRPQGTRIGQWDAEW
jgi:hypothetical protein